MAVEALAGSHPAHEPPEGASRAYWPSPGRLFDWPSAKLALRGLAIDPRIKEIGRGVKMTAQANMHATKPSRCAAFAFTSANRATGVHGVPPENQHRRKGRTLAKIAATAAETFGGQGLAGSRGPTPEHPGHRKPASVNCAKRVQEPHRPH
jgi:hypothetical protein